MKRSFECKGYFFDSLICFAILKYKTSQEEIGYSVSEECGTIVILSSSLAAVKNEFSDYSKQAFLVENNCTNRIKAGSTRLALQ